MIRSSYIRESSTSSKSGSKCDEVAVIAQHAHSYSSTRAQVRAPMTATSSCAVVMLIVYICSPTTLSAVDAQRIGGTCVDTNPPEERFQAGKVNNVISLTENKLYRLRLYGTGFTGSMTVKFTEAAHSFGTNCDMDSLSHTYAVEVYSELTGTIAVNLPKPANSTWYLCMNSGPALSTTGSDAPRWIHQGDETWLQLAVVAETSPYTVGSLPLQIVLVIGLQLLSGLFAGLNLGLMSLDITELKMIENSGTRKERKYARRIRPLRESGNLLLCTLVLGNVIINSTLTILLDNLTGSGVYAVLAATVGITIFGEILPQALCSRYGLAIGSHTFWVTKMLLLITFIIAWPISKVLDLVLGEEIGAVYNRERLAELIKLSHEHDKLASDEAHIIAGALELKTKTAGEIMTPLADVFMIPADAVLNFSSVSEIMRQGYTRIPIYETTPDNIVALLNIKDLCLVDPDDNTPVLTLCKFYNNHVHFVLDDTTLDVLLDTFRRGQTHLALVQRIETAAAGDRDPEYQTVGVVTLEDVIEEIIQAEIVDESDLVSSDPRKRHAMRARNVDGVVGGGGGGGGNKDFSLFHSNYAASLITPQLQLAAFQFLSAAVEHFRSDLITPTILHRLINHLDVAVSFHLRSEVSFGASDLSSMPLIYQAGKSCDYFVLILEGRVEVKCGKEGITFHGGPFSYFGISALTIGRQDEDLYVRARVGENSTAPPVTGATVGSDGVVSVAGVGVTPLTPNGNVAATLEGARPRTSDAAEQTSTRTSLKTERISPAPPKLPSTTSEKHPLISSTGNAKTIKEHSVVTTTYNTADADRRNDSDASRACDAAGQAAEPADFVAETAAQAAANSAADAQQQQQQYQTLLSRTDLVGETSQPFIPDYDVRPVSDLLYLRITRAHYIAAFRASQYERKTQAGIDRGGSGGGGGMRSAVEYFRSEFDKFSHHKHHVHHHQTSQPHAGSGGGSIAAAAAAGGIIPSGSASMRGRPSVTARIIPPAGAALFRPPSQIEPPLNEQEIRPSSSTGSGLNLKKTSITDSFTALAIPNQSTQINTISRQLLQHRQPSMAGNMQYLSLQQPSSSASGGRASPKAGSGSKPNTVSRQLSSSSSSFVMGGVMDKDSEPSVNYPPMNSLTTPPATGAGSLPSDDAQDGVVVSPSRLITWPTRSTYSDEHVANDNIAGDDADTAESDVQLSEKGRRTHEKLVKQGQVDNWNNLPSISFSENSLHQDGLTVRYVSEPHNGRSSSSGTVEENGGAGAREGGAIVSGAPLHSNIKK